jgi:hypothetical protein
VKEEQRSTTDAVITVLVVVAFAIPLVVFVAMLARALLEAL